MTPEEQNGPEGHEGHDSEGLQTLLEFLKHNRGFDFSGYKATSLERRIRRRMQELDIPTYEEYLDHLQVTPDEFTDLFNTILINVTGFFRDKPAWDYITETIVPDLLETVPESDPVRVWSAACATGEEAYTLAMVFAEALGEEEFKRRVKIYATDVDEEALTRARQGAFTRDALKALPDGYAAKYFEAGPLGQMFRADLRRSVIFGRNDLVQDAPISRIDLLVSRNALMYFTPETQVRILNHFNFALRDTGYLFLGKSEMLMTHSDLFTPHSLKWRVFKKVPRRALRDRLAFVASRGELDAPERLGELRVAALDEARVATVVVDREGFVTMANHRARELFGLGAADIGRPLQDLELSYRPADLRTALERAYDVGDEVALERISWSGPGERLRTIQIRVAPLAGNEGEPVGATITFEDITEAAQLEDEHERQRSELESAYEELQSTIEELETTNEELHSTNEELETTNEELQSSNEELETMNEELQSTNDELEAMNESQTSRTAELDKVNMFLEGILSSLGVGVVVLDGDHRVQVWNANSTDLWGLRADEVEARDFLSLDLGLPVEDLREPLDEVGKNGGPPTERTVPAVTRRGKSVDCVVRILPLRSGDGRAYGTLMLMSVTEDGSTSG